MTLAQGFGLGYDTRLQLTKNGSECMFKLELRISHVIPGDFEGQNPSKKCENSSQGDIFVIVSCERVLELLEVILESLSGHF